MCRRKTEAVKMSPSNSVKTNSFLKEAEQTLKTKELTLELWNSTIKQRIMSLPLIASLKLLLVLNR